MSITKRIDHTTAIQSEYAKTIVPAPKSVKISLDDNCQFRCKFCTSRLQPDKCQMDWNLFTALIDELVIEGAEEIGLFYIGEPFLAVNLPRAVRYCKENGIQYVFLTTNGHLATKDKVEILMQEGLDSLKWSFNYADGWQIKAVAGVSPRTYEKIVQNMKDAFEVRNTKGYACRLYASSIMFDGDQGERMKGAVERVRPFVDEHYWLPCFSFGGQANYGNVVAGNPGRLDNPREPLPCWAVFKEGHVTASGKVSLCCFDSHERWIVGDLRTESFMECWNSDKAQALRAAHLKKDVRGTACEYCAVRG